MASPIKYESKQARHSLADSNYILIPHLSKRSEESLKLVNMTVSHKQTVCVNVLFMVITAVYFHPLAVLFLMKAC